MVVIEGMNHIQIADGDINGVNWILKNNELRSEITLEQAHQGISDIIYKFINIDKDGHDLKKDINDLIEKS